MPIIQFVVVGTLAVLGLTLVILAAGAIKRRGKR